MGKYKGKKVLILGFGVTGISLVKFMCKQGARVVVSDIKQRAELNDSLKECAHLRGIEYDLGKHSPEHFQDADLIIVSPGIPLDLRPLQEARERGVVITNEVDLGASHLEQPLIGITGTNGKTTTTSVIAEMFKEDGRSAYVCGNIGNPIINYVTDEQKADFIVAELSSFQLELIEKLVPAVALFTNLDQDHLDRYHNMEAYIDAKKKLLQACQKSSFVVLNYDDPIVSRFSLESPGRTIWFTKRNPLEIGGDFAEGFVGCYYLANEKKIIGKFTGEEEVYDVSKLRLFGDHNKENVMAAICVARTMAVSSHAIQKVIDTFPGVRHRLEFIRRKGGVFFINDSKATNVMSLNRSLEAFQKNPIILIAGGKDKDMDFTPVRRLVEDRVKLLILIGEAKEKINRALGDYTETYLLGTFEEAVLLAYQKSQSGDIILLSPGCASYDMFRNYEERGDYFTKLVNNL